MGASASGVATPPTAPTPVQRTPEKPVQRTAHTSAVGHGIGLGGNAALYGFGTYGWGAAATIGGIVLTSLGIKHLRHRRRGGGGLFGGRGGRGGLLGRLGGRGRSGGGLGLGGGRGRSGGRGGLFGGGRSGGRGSGAGGFLRRLAGGRSSSPRSGGGIPGRGAGGRGLLGGRRGARSGGLGGRSPGSRRGGGGLLGGGRGRGSGRGGSRGGSTRGGGLFGNRGNRGGRKGGLLSGLNPFRSRNGARSHPGSAIGRGTKGGRRLFDWLNPFRRKKPKTKKQQQAQNQPSGWKEVPLNPNTTRWKDREMNAPAPKRVPKPTGGTNRGGGGGLTQAAEQFAGTLAKPPTEVNTLKTFDEDLGDLAGAVEALRGGMNQHTSVVEAGMPAETYAHEQLRQATRQLGQVAESIKSLQAEARRKLALDHERVDNGRPNEQGYDWRANQR